MPLHSRWRLFWNVCSRFHGNMCILKPILQNDMGVFLTWYFMKTQKGYIAKPQMYQLHFKPISVQIRAFAEMIHSSKLASFFCTGQTNCLCIMNLWISIKRVNNLLFEFFFIDFLKVRVFWKFFLVFFLHFEKKWFPRENKYFFL